MSDTEQLQPADEGRRSTELLSPAWRLRAWISERLQGGCRVLSQGSDCQCPLCDLDRMRDALQWYAAEAEACAKNSNSGNHAAPHALMASVTVLALDGGKRTRDAGGA